MHPSVVNAVLGAKKNLNFFLNLFSNANAAMHLSVVDGVPGTNSQRVALYSECNGALTFENLW
jgi:hypothetical protein